MAKRPVIDVVVPVHDDYEAVAACFASLREHGGYHRLILVDDASTDPRVRALVSNAGSASLSLRNERRLGSIAATNRGLASTRNAVVVVPPSAIVTAGWLSHLCACLGSAPDIGTATPLTTRSIPFAAEHDADAVAAAAEVASVPLYPDAAPAGPVLLINREVLSKAGMPDAALCENDAWPDFARRVKAAGFRNVVCDGAYVATTSSAAHGDADDSLAPTRAMLRTQLRAMSRGDRPAVLHVAHPRGGGTEKYIRELIAARTEYRHYFLRIHADRWHLAEAGDGMPAYERLRADGTANGQWLASMCAWLRIGLIHVHSVVGSGDDLLQMITATALPYCYSVHDMYLPCPTVYLIDSDGRYCNATTDAAVCRRCLSRFGDLDTQIERWRERYAGFLANAARVFAPSQWARETLLRYYPQCAVTIAPPREEPVPMSAVHDMANVAPLPDDDHRSIGILGAIGPEKGARNIDALVARIRERKLPLRIVIVGYTDTLARFRSDDSVLIVHGAYARDEVEALLDAYRIPLLLFPTVWPETFSYTLSEGWIAGRPALVPPRGALAERVAATGAGWIIDDWPHVDALLDQLVRLTSNPHHAELQDKAALARAVFADERRPLATDLYGDLMDEVRTLADAHASRYGIYESACRALGVAPMKPVVARRDAEPATAVHRLMRMLLR